MPQRRSAFARPGRGGKLLGNAGVVLLVFVWHWSSQNALAGIFPGPLEIGQSLAEGLQDPAFLAGLAASTMRVLVSLLLALIIGAVLALLPFWWAPLNSTVHAVIKPFFNSFPAIAWALLASIWFGVSDFTVVFVQTAILIPFCLVNISEGVRALDKDLLEMSDSFAGRAHRGFFVIVMPLLLPYIVSSMRSAYGVAWKIAIVAELFGARTGLGYALLRAENVSDMDRILAICLVIVIVGMAGDRWVIARLEARTRHIKAMD